MILEVIPAQTDAKRTRPTKVISLAEPSTSRICPPPALNTEEVIIDLCEDVDRSTDAESMDVNDNEVNDSSDNFYGIKIGDSFTIENDHDIQIPRRDISDFSDDDDGFEEMYIGHEVIEENVDDEVVDVLSANKVKHIPLKFLKPFHYGWKREVVMRGLDTSPNTAQYDVYYWPPEPRAAKCRSKPDLVKHFAKYDSNGLTTDNFIYNRKPLGLNNPEFEIIRRCRRDAKALQKKTRKQSKKKTK